MPRLPAQHAFQALVHNRAVRGDSTAAGGGFTRKARLRKPEPFREPRGDFALFRRRVIVDVESFVRDGCRRIETRPHRRRDVLTVVEREDLSEIDLRHLYEPGPAKHALRVFLRTLEPGDIVFRTNDGSPVSVQEMLELLQSDDPLAKAFLEDVHGEAVRAVRVKSKRQGDA